MTLDTKTLPQTAVEEDHRLEAGTERASEQLAKHRWYWTLDESNPKRVPIREYARQVGRSHIVIYRYAMGYAAWKVLPEPVTPLVEQIERAGVSAEQEASIEAVAKARGQTFAHVRRHRPKEVRDLRNAARDTAERKGTSITDELPDLAAFIVKSEESERQQEVAHKERHPLRYIEVEGHLSNATRSLRLAEKAMTDVPFDTEERDLLRRSLELTVAIAHLIDTRLAGTTVLDWDAELTKIMEGATR